MLSKAGWWGAPAAIAVFAAMAIAPSRALGQAAVTSTFDENVEASAFCPSALIVKLKGTPAPGTGIMRYYRGVAFRGFSGLVVKVWYTYDEAPQEGPGGYYTASGNFWLWGWECRTLNMGNPFNVPPDRIEMFEREIFQASGGGGNCIGKEDEAPSYDPYYGESQTDPTCGGGGGTEGSSTDCPKEYMVIEISDDGGATWRVYWEGYVLVC